jgi:polyhydroxyalkanoate synthase
MPDVQTVRPLRANPLLGNRASAAPRRRRTGGRRRRGRSPPLLHRTRQLAGELGEIAVGHSEREPAAQDRRFADPAFRENPIYRRLMQIYLAWREAVLGLVDDLVLEASGRERARLAITLLTAAVAPTNTLLGNPAALRRAVETGGPSLWRGLRNLAHDVTRNGGMPSQVDRGAFRVGADLAVTRGEVVLRNEVLELLQFAPTTATVHQVPLLLIPPQINKYYVLDLAPGRSLVSHAVDRGFTVFAVSWRNPTSAQRDWGIDTYIGALCEAADAVRAITGSDQLNLFGACAGGITTAVLLGHWGARGDGRVRAATLPVTVLDTHAESALGIPLSEKAVTSALARSSKQGILGGREMSRVFAWLRPNDLVWSYWVNNYLLGARPAAFDILYWNSDLTNLPATLHAEFLELVLKNSLCHPGELEVRGTPVDLGAVRADLYAVGGSSDHITPWQSVYRTPRLFGGQRTFVLTSRPWSIRRATAKRCSSPTRPPTPAARMPPSGMRGRAATRGPGGTTGPSGSPRAPASSVPPPSGQEATRSLRSSPLPGATSPPDRARSSPVHPPAVVARIPLAAGRPRRLEQRVPPPPAAHPHAGPGSR